MSTDERLAELERRADEQDAAIAVLIDRMEDMCREAGMIGKPAPPPADARRYRHGLFVVREGDAS